MRAFTVYFRKMTGLRCLLPILTVTALCFFSHVDTGARVPPTLIEQTFAALSQQKNMPTYQQVIACFDNSYWFYIILPVILSVSAVSDLSEEWFGGGYYLNIHRQNIPRYTISKAGAYSLNSVICFIFGFVLFMLPVMIVFPSESAESLNSVYPEGFWLHILSRLSNSAALAAVYPLFCVAAVIIIRDKFLSLSLPMLLNYITGQIGAALLVKSYRSETPMYETLAMLMPYMQSRQYTGFERVFGLPVWVWYLSCAMCFALLTAAVYLLIKRRIKTDA